MTLPTGILMAAGNSERFGTQKLMAPMPGGESVGLAAARHLIAVLPRSIAVVRPGDDDLRAGLEAFGFRLVENSDPASGMGASLALAVKASPDAHGWLVTLADMPWMRQSSIRLVAERIKSGASIASTRYGGQRGHPVGFAAKWGRSLADLKGDKGAKHLLANHSEELECLDVDDPGVLRDVDVPEDLKQA